ncbi:autotransporter domain-containing protein [Xanthobacter sp. DSM 24535]|uniref:autotransporter outer membrane beta-barrel domain-containing protein n=1 Tax=Roseixanthobacter psychrophilus TaxID=3119917 RepID=UPI003728354F
MKTIKVRRWRLMSSVAPLALAGLGVCVTAPVWAEPSPTPTPYTTLNYGTTGTFLTGIRGNTIVGNYVVPGTTATGGLLYNMSTGQWSAMPVATANGVNYPDAIGSSPYGPSFGNQGGVLRTVGSYITSASSPYDLSYLYDAAAAPGQQITQLAYPSASGNPTLYTIAHSTFGDTVVGNYDTRLATGNAMIYTISTGTYTTNNKPGAASTTAYGVYGNMIAGGYFDVPGGGIGAEHGYLYNQTTDTWATYDHPGAVVTHLEGITGAGRSGEYNMVADWVTVDGVVHAGVLHVDALGIPTWYEINIPGASLVSSNSAYGDTVVGIYLTPGSTTPNGYVATIEGIYNPIRNTGTLTSSADNAAALSGRIGDDIVNSGTVQVSGNGGIGMRGETYGVLTNTGTVVSTGIAGAAVELHGLYGTFLNYGILQTTAASDALRTGPDSFGTVIVNTGIIDGRLAATAGPQKRFENSGWLGVSGTGVSITHLLSGTFVQTSAGTLSLRVTSTGTDFMGITGVARLAGTLEVPFQTSTLANSYTLLAATEGTTGAFETLATSGLPSYVSPTLAYSGTNVSLNLTSQMAQQAGLTSNQTATGAALDRAFNSGASANTGNSTWGALGSIYSLSASQLPAALKSLSGEAYASEQSVLIGDGIYGRQAVMDRLRQGAYAGQSGPMGALAYGGPAAMSYAGPEAASRAAPSSALGALAYATKAPAVAPEPTYGTTVWAQGFGGWTNLDGNGNASSVSETIGGVISGADIRAGNWRIGAALGYSQSNADVGAVASSTEVNSMLVALYAGTSAGPWNLRLGASYAFNQIDATRTIAMPGLLQQANAQYDGGTAQVFGEVGYGFALQSIALEPYAGLAWVQLNTDSFAESGSVAALSGASTSAGVGYSSLGLRAATAVALSNGMVLAPHASAAWQYAFGDVDPTAQLAFRSLPGANFTVGGVPLAENTALLEVGADLHLSAQARFGLSYVGQFADGVTVNAFQANVAWRF